MNEALRLSLPDPTSRVVLVGYSGGGTIAALMARDNPRISVIVTIAGNLDVKAWSERHHYLPLSDSRNPADESALPATLKQVHLIGERDTKVTPLTASRYLSRLANEQVWRYPRFDHVCCWQQAWPDIRTRIQRAIESDAPLQAAPEN